jgi:predicted lipid-binding transport protein (Tim44 family)
MQDIDGSSLIALALLALLYWNIWDSLRLFTPPDEKTKGRRTADGPTGAPADATPADQQAADTPIEGLDRCAPGAMQGVLAIQSRDATFNLARFLASASAAYEAVVIAFALGDRTTLQRLVSPHVYAVFESDIDARERNGHHMETTFAHIAPPEVTSAYIAGDTAQITVRFVSEMFSVTRSPAGAVVRGSADTKEITADVWTFAKATASSDEAWMLVATDSD